MEKFYYEVFIPYLKSNEIDIVWILGDIFENRKLINIYVLQRVHRFFEELEKQNITVYCISGNHDYYFKNTNEVGPLKNFFRSYENVNYISVYDCFKFDSLNVGFISWIPPEQKEKCLSWIRTVDAPVLCGHFDINSFEIIKGLVCTQGLNLELFSRFEKVFSGHFHIRASNGIIHYIGNPYQTNWGEAEYEKGFAIFDTNTLAISYVNNPITVYEILYIDKETKINNIDFNNYSDKVVKIIIDKDSETKRKMPLIIDKISQVSFSTEIIEDKDIVIQENLKFLNPATNPIDIINEFIDTCLFQDTKNINLLKQKVIEIYGEALERGNLEC
jgi:DNA repair exonuclease SbcCD nuclease subunit